MYVHRREIPSGEQVACVTSKLYVTVLQVTGVTLYELEAVV